MPWLLSPENDDKFEVFKVKFILSTIELIYNKRRTKNAISMVPQL